MNRLAATLCCTLAAVALADIGPSRPAPKPPPQCQADAECTITTFTGCCGGCCPVAPYAMSVKALQASQQRCAAVRCAAPPCDRVECAAVVPDPPSAFRAVCEAGRCVARPAAASAECRNSAECTVVQAAPPPGSACHSSPCGCCPTNVAVSVERARPTPAPTPTKPPTKDGKEGAPPFGLSTGNTGGTRPTVTPPACSPCPMPPPADAECVAGKCTLVPVRPRPQPPG